jgi:filamentous hemagglutinin family protein
MVLSPFPGVAQTLPQNGTVVAGSVTIGSPAPGTLGITQTSQNAIVNWNSFSVGAGNAVVFRQPSASSAILNRVTGSASTAIAGQVSANGQVYLVNPNGILITETGTVNAAGFTASTLDTSDADFLAGRRVYNGAGNSAGVENRGIIRVTNGGDVVLAGGRIGNSGLIEAIGGRIGLGAGEHVAVDIEGDGFLTVSVPTDEADLARALIEQTGRIEANGGRVEIRAATTADVARSAIQLGGNVSASSFAQTASGVSFGGDGGALVVHGGAGGKVAVTGTLEARSATGVGGSITLAAREIELATAGIDASGAAGGGDIRIGGDWQGHGDMLRAGTVSVDAGSTIAADATARGDGGRVVIWSDDLTSFSGTITARGGSLSGNGGDAEVSGKARLAYTGYADLTAAGGALGNLLLDPYNITISTAGSSNVSGFSATGNDSVINATTLLNALSGANVTVMTGSSGSQAGNITVAAPLSWAGSATLTLQAAGGIAIDSPITAASGGLTLAAGSTISASGAISVADFTLTSGNWVQNGSSLPGFSAANFTIDGGSFLRVLGGDGTSATRYRLTDIYGLQGVGSSTGYLSSYWTLANDIDASGTAGWNGGAGFKPIGSGSGFTGSFDGLGHTVSNITINRPAEGNVGLFGLVGGDGSTGPRAIANVGLTGSVTGGAFTGGLVGHSWGGAVSNAWSGAAVTGGANVGGLVGLSTNGTITRSYATGAVNGVEYLGGLVGRNENGQVTNAYATGPVSGSYYVGGLVGYNSGAIDFTYALGSVNGSAYVGGLAGRNLNAISNSYATGAVSGSTAGGLVGWNDGIIGRSFWDQDTTGRSNGCGHNSSDCSGTGLTTVQARSSAAYTGWNFTSVWYQAGDMRPILHSEAATATNGVITITNLHQLALLGRGANFNASYVLGRDIDASETAGSNAAGIWSSAGWVPIGDSNFSFYGVLDGQGHTISGLTINRPGVENVGLFRMTGMYNNGGAIRNLGLVGGSITGGRNTGALLGFSYFTTISNVYATANVTGADYTGGLVGYSHETRLSNVHATGAVVGDNFVGGLTGYAVSSTTISDAYATGNVTGIGNVGGFVGNVASTTISRAYATGNVIGSGDSVGGFTGGSSGTLIDVYATGSVAGGQYVGGLVGYTFTSTVRNAYASGAVSGAGYVGGLFGFAWAPTTSALFWDRQASGQNSACGAGSGSCIGPTGLVGDQMANAFTYIAAGWDFGSVWALPKAGGAPVLRSLAAEPVYDYYIRISGNASRAYGDTIAPGATVEGIGVANVTLDWGNGITASTGTGFYGWGSAGVLDLSYAAGSASDYYIVHDGGLVINARAITVTAGAASRAYGDVNPDLTYSVGGAGLVNGDTLSGALTTSAGQYANVGTYAIGQGTLTGSANYAITYVGADLTVTPRAVTVTANAASRTYGDVNPALTWTADGLVNNDTLSGALATNAVQYSGVGIYTIGQGTLAASANYAITYLGADLTIGQRALTVTASSAGKTYGDVNPTLTYTTVGLVNNDTLTGALTTGAGQYSGVGAYAIGLGTLGNANYAITYNGADLTIGQRALTVTANAAAKTYGDANPALTWSAAGLVNNDTLAGALTTSAGQYSDIGAYAIGLGTLGNANYAITYVGADLTVGQRALTVTANAAGKTYGDANPTLTYTTVGLVNNDTLTGTLATSAGQYSDVGAYAIGLGTLGNANYVVTYSGANLTIGQRALTVTADARSKSYGDGNPPLTWTASGLVNNDTLTGALTTSAGQYSDVGTYAIGQGSLAASGNYAVTYVGADLMVAQRAITVTADAASKTYGDANPVLAYTASGLVNGDTLTGSLATGATRYSSVGNYAITHGSLDHANYAITYVGANLTVNRRTVTVTANAVSRIYGDANPALTYTASGLVNGDTLSGNLATSATGASGVGRYAITQGSLANDNYAIGYAGADLTVLARAIAIAAIDASRPEGTPDPVLGYVVTSGVLVNGDVLTGTPMRDAGETFGKYAIRLGSLAWSANYDVSFAEGVFEITPLASGPSPAHPTGPNLTPAGLKSNSSVLDGLLEDELEGGAAETGQCFVKREGTVRCAE